MLVLLAGMGLHSAPARAQSEATQAFAAGVEQVRLGEFEAALRYFQRARELGDRSPRLQFNLGVAYYRLNRLEEARVAFLLASAGRDTHDLALYNVGLVALAGGDLDEATRRFRTTAREAKSANLRALAVQALARAQGAQAKPLRGSFSLLRGEDSNVVIPLSTGNDVASGDSDGFTELRAAWSDTFFDEGRWGYRLAGVMTQYDSIDGANIGFGEVALDYRGPVNIALASSALFVADSGYQRSTDLRLTATLLNQGPYFLLGEGGYSWVDALGDGPETLEGNRYYLGGIAGFRTRVYSGSLSLRRIHNERELAALSPKQNALGLNLRLVPTRRLSFRASARYTDSDYPTGRADELVEFSGEAAYRFYRAVHVVLEAARYENRSSEPSLRYKTDKLYAGLKLQF